MLSLGLAIIFGLLNIINVTHGAQYMMGAFCAWMLLNHFGIGYWPSLIIAPIVVGAPGSSLNASFLRRVYQLDHIYGFLLTLGLSLLIEGAFRQRYGISGQPYDIPDALLGGFDLGFVFLPAYRVWIVVFSTDGLLRHLVPDRAHPARRDLARGDREPGADAGVRHQRAAHDHADLRLRRRARRSRRRDGRADLPGRAPMMGVEHPRGRSSPSS